MNIHDSIHHSSIIINVSEPVVMRNPWLWMICMSWHELTGQPGMWTSLPLNPLNFEVNYFLVRWHISTVNLHVMWLIIIIYSNIYYSSWFNIATDTCTYMNSYKIIAFNSACFIIKVCSIVSRPCDNSRFDGKIRGKNRAQKILNSR